MGWRKVKLHDGMIGIFLDVFTVDSWGGVIGILKYPSWRIHL